MFARLEKLHKQQQTIQILKENSMIFCLVAKVSNKSYSGLILAAFAH